MKYGMDLMKKSNPEILVATPGRLKAMIESQLFSLESLQWVIFDECDRLLNGDFDGDLNPLRAVLPRGARNTVILTRSSLCNCNSIVLVIASQLPIRIQ